MVRAVRSRRRGRSAEPLRQDRGKSGDRRAGHQIGADYDDAEPALDPIQQLDRHQGVEADLGQQFLAFDICDGSAQYPRDLFREKGLENLRARTRRRGGDGVADGSAILRMVAGIAGHSRGEEGVTERIHRAGRHLAPMFEVDPQDSHLRDVRLEKQRDRIKRFPKRDRVPAVPREMLPHLLVPRDVTDLSNRAPIYRERRQPERAPMVREGIEEAVGRGIIRLASVADDGAHRGVEQEKIERQLAGLLMQIPGAGHLWRENSVKPRGIEIGQEAIVEHHRGMHDSGERGHCPGDVGERPGDFAFGADIGNHDDDFRAAIFATADGGPRFIINVTGATGEDHVTRPARDQPLRRRESEAAQAAGDQIRRVRTNPKRPRGRRGTQANLRAAPGEHDFADMFSLRHRMEGALEVA